MQVDIHTKQNLFEDRNLVFPFIKRNPLNSLEGIEYKFACKFK